MAVDPFRALFLRQVRTILSGQPSREALYQLLTTVTPELTDEDLDDESRRGRAFKELCLRVHPDKHPNDDTATAVFQEVPPFYEACVRRLHVPIQKKSLQEMKEDSGGSPSKSTHNNTANQGVIQNRSSCPVDFIATEKWPYLSFQHPVVPNIKVLFAKSNALELCMGYRCINLRGAIAHRARPNLFFGWSKVESDTARFQTTEQIWNAKFRGTRRLDTVEAIQTEVSTRGPVLSTSFVLSSRFSNTTEHSDAFYLQRINQTHPLVIVGWKSTPLGDVWLVYPPITSSRRSTELIPIAFGQFGINTLCLAPESDLQDKAWQAGPFLDLNLSKWPDAWMTWKKCDIHLTSNELEKLSECLGTGFVIAAEKQTRFVLRDERKLAHSRAYTLKDVQWNAAKQMWKVSVLLQAT